MDRIITDQCRYLTPNKLVRSGRREGTWENLPWRISLSERGSRLQVGNRAWELVPILRSGAVEGVWWLVKDSTGRRCNHLLLTDDHRIGTRWELRARHRSQRLWTDEKQSAHQRHKIIERLEGPVQFSWVLTHPHYLPRKPKLMRRATYEKIISRYQRYQ